MIICRHVPGCCEIQELLELEEIDRKQRQFFMYCEFNMNPEESTSCSVYYHWKVFNGDVEHLSVLIESVVERLNQNLVEKLFSLIIMAKEVLSFREEFNKIGYGLCISSEMRRRLRYLIDSRRKKVSKN